MKSGNLMRHSFSTVLGVLPAALFGFAVALTTVSCVSVSLGPKGGEQSKGVQFAAPPDPYRQLKEAHADGAWQNSNNGNSISYLSTCNDPAEPSLDTVARELFAELREMKTLQQSTTVFNSREALELEVEGKVDGVLTRVQALLFKKNGCTYTLSFIGVPRAFESDRKIFEAFVRGFVAP